MSFRLIAMLAAAAVLSACAEEQPPRSVQEFVDNSILLEAAMVRCSRDRVETRYAAECINAREAVKIVSAREEAARRAEYEALSEQKRRAFRRTQDAAAEARRRAEEARRQREEAEYLAQFGVLPDGSVPGEEETTGSTNVPGAILPEGDSAVSGGRDSGTVAPETSPAATGANAQGVFEAEEPEPEEATDLQSIRDELKRRQDEPDQ